MAHVHQKPGNLSSASALGPDSGTFILLSLRHLGLHHLLVAQPSTNIIGLITRQDLVLEKAELTLCSKVARDILHHSPATIAPSDKDPRGSKGHEVTTQADIGFESQKEVDQQLAFNAESCVPPPVLSLMSPDVSDPSARSSLKSDVYRLYSPDPPVSSALG